MIPSERQQASNQLQHELEALINRYTNESDLTIGDILQVTEIVKLNFYMETFYRVDPDTLVVTAKPKERK